MIKFLILFFFGFGAYAQISNTRTIEGTNTPGVFTTKNYVKNPDCAKNVVGITASGGTLAKGTTTPLNEDSGSECAIDASASGQTYTWALNTFGQGMKGQNCEARFVYEGDASLYKAYINNGSTKITTDLQLESSTSGAKPVSINFPCGDLSASNTFVIEATDNAAAAISVAKVYVGLATNLSNVAQATVYGSLKYGGATNCVWSVTGGTVTSPSDFPADTDCNAPTVTGNASAPSTKIPGITFSNLPPGEYEINFDVPFFLCASSSDCTFRISDGTNTSTVQTINSTNMARAHTVRWNTRYTTAQSNITFRLQGAVGSATTLDIYTHLSGYDLYATVKRFPSSSEVALRTDNSNYDWTAFTPSTVGSNGLGTIAAESCFHKRDGKNLLLNCKITVGTTTAAEARITLPNSLTISSTEVPTIRLLDGFWVRSSTTATSHKRGVVIGTGGNSYINFSLDDYTGTTNPLVATNGSVLFANSDVVSFFVSVPITGWVENNKAPLLVGSVTSNSSGLTRTEYATVTPTDGSTCTINSQSGSWLSSTTPNAAGDCTLTIATGIFSSSPVCTLTPEDSANLGVVPKFARVHSVSSTSLRFLVEQIDETSAFASSITAQPLKAHIICMGQR